MTPGPDGFPIARVRLYPIHVALNEYLVTAAQHERSGAKVV